MFCRDTRHRAEHGRQSDADCCHHLPKLLELTHPQNSHQKATSLKCLSCSCFSGWAGGGGVPCFVCMSAAGGGGCTFPHHRHAEDIHSKPGADAWSLICSRLASWKETRRNETGKVQKDVTKGMTCRPRAYHKQFSGCQRLR